VSKIVLGTYITLTPLQILQADIEINKMNQEVSTPSIHSILEAKDSDNTDTATVFIDGFASQDGSWTTKKIADTLQIVNDSDIWALEFSKNRISVPAIAEQIAHKAEHEKVTSVSLYGYSIGGMISLEVAHELIKKYNLNVATIFLDHSPSSRDDIRQSIQDQASPAMEAIQWFHSFGIDIEYSSIARSIINHMYSENISHLGNTPISLMRSQYLYGIDADTKQSFEQLANVTPRPKIIYVTSKDPATDYMIDVEQSEASYEKLSRDNRLPFFVIPVEGAIHSRLDLTVSEYTTAFSEAAETLATEELLSALHPTLYSWYDTDAQEGDK
jgi:pimeloyl-ACP methyl ester carboxylesterase